MRYVLGCALAIAALAAAARFTRPVAPAFEAVRRATRASDAQLLDRHGAVLSEQRTDASRRRFAWTPLGAVSPAVRDAIVSSEDRHFARHGGVDLLALGGAVRDRVVSGASRGASTITMQLAGMLDPALRRRHGVRTLPQKWRQMRLAWAIERAWSKDEILEAYLNLVPVRGEVEGIGAGARVLFQKTPDALDSVDAAVLTALLVSPTAAEPAVIRRARGALVRAGEDPGALRLEDAVRTALAAGGATGRDLALAPHVARRLVAGASRTSTLDKDVQILAREALRRQLVPLRSANVEDGAILVTDNASGDVLAYVGSSGDLSRARFVDGVVARRQAGSALKPFLYALAIERGILTAAALVDDAPLEIAVPDGLYRPRNYDDRFRGPVSVRTALASSLNVPAVRTLGLVGADAFVDRLRALGFAGLTRSGTFYGPSLALGSADVTLWELVNAYRTLANGGRASRLRLASDDPRDRPRPVVAPSAAFIVGEILADRESRSPTFGLENVLATRAWTAVKTGTSKDMRDNWCVGFSTRYTVGVWVGNFNGEPMRDVSGVTGAAPIWREIMAALEGDVAAPEPPPDVVRAAVSFDGGVEPPRAEWFIRGTAPRAPIARAPASPRILAPASGTIVAVDPDIPAAHQRLAFEAPRDTTDAVWVLDGIALGPAAGIRLWPPQPGRHRLALRASDGRQLDQVAFEVRGRAVR